VLTDHFKDAGPLAGIERGLDAMTTTLLLVLAVDMPRRMEVAGFGRKAYWASAQGAG
jgi:molybdopterin-guanine dinucleotide biosynthesis protein A